jgi:HD-GYP domain-containing protein (c-di-GMP phosphodiesterase class II)
VSPPTQWRTECLRRRFNAVIALPIELDSGVWGALGIASDRVGAFDEPEVHVLQQLAANVSFALSVLETRQERDAAARRAEMALAAVTESLSKALEWRDPYTAGHERRVAVLSAILGRELGLDDDDLRGIEVAAGIHDIGKIAVPAEILSNPGVLNSAQLDLLRAHCQIGYDIIREADFPWPVAQMVLQHHERLDGSGYPNGLVDGQIGVGARIIAVADVVEAMAAHRPYRPAHPLPEAVDHIIRQRGVLYDPDVADALQVLFNDGRLAEICKDEHRQPS